MMNNMLPLPTMEEFAHLGTELTSAVIAKLENVVAFELERGGVSMTPTENGVVYQSSMKCKLTHIICGDLNFSCMFTAPAVKLLDPTIRRAMCEGYIKVLHRRIRRDIVGMSAKFN
jgi:hypothetical protein